MEKAAAKCEAELPAHAAVVSHHFPMPGWERLLVQDVGGIKLYDLSRRSSSRREAADEPRRGAHGGAIPFPGGEPLPARGQAQAAASHPAKRSRASSSASAAAGGEAKEKRDKAKSEAKGKSKTGKAQKSEKESKDRAATKAKAAKVEVADKKTKKAGKAQKADKTGKAEKSPGPGAVVKAPKVGKASKADKDRTTGRAEKAEKTEKKAKDKASKPGKAEIAEKASKPQKVGKPDKTDKGEKADTPRKSEGADTGGKTERAASAERPSGSEPRAARQGQKVGPAEQMDEAKAMREPGQGPEEENVQPAAKPQEGQQEAGPPADPASAGVLVAAGCSEPTLREVVEGTFRRGPPAALAMVAFRSVLLALLMLPLAYALSQITAKACADKCFTVTCAPADFPCVIQCVHGCPQGAPGRREAEEINVRGANLGLHPLRRRQLTSLLPLFLLGTGDEMSALLQKGARTTPGNVKDVVKERVDIFKCLPMVAFRSVLLALLMLPLAYALSQITAKACADKCFTVTCAPADFPCVIQCVHGCPQGAPGRREAEEINVRGANLVLHPLRRRQLTSLLPLFLLGTGDKMSALLQKGLIPSSAYQCELGATPMVAFRSALLALLMLPLAHALSQITAKACADKCFTVTCAPITAKACADKCFTVTCAPADFPCVIQCVHGCPQGALGRREAEEINVRGANLGLYPLRRRQLTSLLPVFLLGTGDKMSALLQKGCGLHWDHPPVVLALEAVASVILSC
ncbi:unnamed protein product [Prorocentrum cordatum]|nr:unnamed protein product [Polarella glacialis]